MWSERRAAVDAADDAAGRDRPRGYDDYEVSLGDAMRGERATLGKSLLDVQRELRIKAAYVAAIENCDADAFETSGFVAGYVRSYARYLGLDADWAFETFCAESGFRPPHDIGPARGGRRPTPQAPVTLARERDIFADRPLPYGGDALFGRIDLRAVMSIAVLLAVLAGVGWGGLSFVSAFQSVRLAPVNDVPGALTHVDPLAPAAPALVEAPATPEPEALERLYQPRAPEVPQLVPRDGPIAAIDPETLVSPGATPTASPEPPRLLADARTPAPEEPSAVEEGPNAIDSAVLAALADTGDALDLQAPALQGTGVAEGTVVLLVSRPSWVRVQAADGSTLLETIMEPGERFTTPAGEAPPVLRTGNAGGVYFQTADGTFGPAGADGSVISDVALEAESLSGRFPPADLTSDPELERIARVAEAAAEAEAPQPAE